MVPGSPLWLSKMSASKVAAVLGLSPYDSRFSLYYKMAGIVEPEPQTNEMARGHYLEPAIAHWFQDQHPEWDVRPGGSWQHETAEWYTAGPDRLIHVSDTEIVGLEIKTDDNDSRWGEPGTDEVPVHVRAQVQSQMDVVGTRRTYIGFLSCFLEFREYVVDFDQAEADLIRDECAQFMDDLANNVRPNLDAHTATYQTIRALHPEIDGMDVELDYELARSYCLARQTRNDAERNWQAATNLMADTIGNARRGRYLERTLATRQAKGDGKPYLVVGRNLPTFDLEPSL